MVAEVRIYYEGDDALREGFRQFFSELHETIGQPVRPIAGKSKAIADFKRALNSHPDAMNILLIDSEGPDDGMLFKSRCQPLGIDPAQKKAIFWMVQCMESWFLADIERLSDFYRKNLRKALHSNPKIEEIPKRDVLAKLNAATRDTQKGPYHKTKHAPHILRLIRPANVKKAAPSCRRLFEMVPRLYVERS